MSRYARNGLKQTGTYEHDRGDSTEVVAHFGTLKFDGLENSRTLHDGIELYHQYISEHSASNLHGFWHYKCKNSDLPNRSTILEVSEARRGHVTHSCIITGRAT